MVAPIEDSAYYQHQKEENTFINKHSYEYTDEFRVHKTESIDIVNEQIDCISPGIQSCLQFVSNVDEEDRVELAYPEKEREECVNLDSKSKVRIYR